MKERPVVVAVVLAASAVVLTASATQAQEGTETHPTPVATTSPLSTTTEETHGFDTVTYVPLSLRSQYPGLGTLSAQYTATELQRGAPGLDSGEPAVGDD